MATGYVFMAMSLDGFVARPDHGLDWLMKYESAGEDHGYDDFFAGVDGVVMGRRSFQTVLGLGNWRYTKPVVVMSGTLSEADVPAALRGKVRIMRTGPAEVMQNLDREGWSRVYVDGGQVVQSFLRLGLISDICLTLVPVLIGRGCRLFGQSGRDIELELPGTRSFASGLVQTRYRVVEG